MNNFDEAYNKWLQICQVLPNKIKNLDEVLTRELKVFSVDFFNKHNLSVPELLEYASSFRRVITMVSELLDGDLLLEWHNGANILAEPTSAIKNALHQEEKDARLLMHILANTVEYSEFYGQNMTLVNVIGNDFSGHWNTLLETVRQLREKGFRVEVKYCVFDTNNKLLNNSYGNYYVYANINDVYKYKCAYTIWSKEDLERLPYTAPTSFELLYFGSVIYPGCMPLDSSHKAVYIETVNI